MEQHGVYAVGGARIASCLREETLRPAESWMAPTPDEINLALSMANWSAEKLGKKTGVQGSTIRCYLRGEKKIPFAVWAVLCDEAGLGKIW